MVCCYGCVPHSPFPSVSRALLWYQMHVFVERIMGNVPWRLIGHVWLAALCFHDAFLGSQPLVAKRSALPTKCTESRLVCVGALGYLSPSLPRVSRNRPDLDEWINKGVYEKDSLYKKRINSPTDMCRGSITRVTATCCKLYYLYTSVTGATVSSLAKLAKQLSRKLGEVWCVYTGLVLMWEGLTESLKLKWRGFCQTIAS